MAGQETNPSIAALRKLEASLQLDMLQGEVGARTAPPHDSHHDALPPRLLRSGWRYHLGLCWHRLRAAVYVTGALAGLVLIGLGALWWRLANGPIELDLATPWLTAAIEENFGSGHRVEVG